MPIYEYKCEMCGAAYEQLRRMQDADGESECPACASVKTRRLMSSFASSSPGSAAAGACAPRPGRRFS